MDKLSEVYNIWPKWSINKRYIIEFNNNIRNLNFEQSVSVTFTLNTIY